MLPSPDCRYELIVARMRAIIDGTCAAYGARGTLEMDSMYAVLENHAEQADVVKARPREGLTKSLPSHACWWVSTLPYLWGGSLPAISM